MKKSLFSKIFEIIKKIYKDIKLKAKLRQMDEMWYLMGGNCFGLYPPSFYHTHTPEEIEKITKEDIEELKVILRKHEEEKGLFLSDEAGI